MEALTHIWEEFTQEFSQAQKIIVGIVLAFIVVVALSAVVLLILDVLN